MGRKKRSRVRAFRFRAYDMIANLVFGAPFFVVASVLLAGPLLDYLFRGRFEPKTLLVSLFGVVAFRLLVGQYRRARAWIGEDGIAFTGRRPKTIPKFVAWTDIDRVIDDSGFLAETAKVVLRDGTSFRIPRVGMRHRDLNDFLKACRDAIVASRRRAKREVPAALLQDDDRKERGYREARVPKDVLLEVAAEPSAPPKVRVRAIEMAAEAGAKQELAELFEVTAEPSVAKKLEKYA